MKSLLLAALLAFGSSDTSNIAPLDVMVRGMPPLEQTILEKHPENSIPGTLYHLYFNSEYPKETEGWMLDNMLEVGDTTRVSVKFFIPYLPWYKIEGGFGNIGGYFKHYRYISTKDDTLFCANENGYEVSGSNMIQFFGELKKRLYDKPLETYVDSLPWLYYDVLIQMKHEEEYIEKKKTDVGVEFKRYDTILGKEYLLVSIVPLNFGLLNRVSFFRGKDIPWIFVDTKLPYNFRIISTEFDSLFGKKDPFYEIYREEYED